MKKQVPAIQRQKDSRMGNCRRFIEDYDFLHLGLLKTVLPKPLGGFANDNIGGNEHVKKAIG